MHRHNAVYLWFSSSLLLDYKYSISTCKHCSKCRFDNSFQLSLRLNSEKKNTVLSFNLLVVLVFFLKVIHLTFFLVLNLFVKSELESSCFLNEIIFQ